MAALGFILKLFQKENTISPAISNLLKTARDPLPVLRAMGTTFKSITEGTFNSVGASYRPKPWKAKRDGSPSNLQKSTTMAKSFQLQVSSTEARLSNPMKYAAVHQFGATIVPVKAEFLRFKLPDGSWVSCKRVVIPARPFFPIEDGKLTPAAEEKILRAGQRVVDKQAGQNA